MGTPTCDAWLEKMPSKDTFAEPSSFEVQRKDEEHLPVYQRSEQADSNILPASQASAEEVRHFIIHVLVSRRQLSLDDARRVATRWTVGSGLELRTYSPSMYLEVFGSEHGWILYKELRPIIDAESQGKTIDHYGPGLVVAVLFVYFVMSLIFINLKKDAFSFVMGLGGILASGLGILMIMKIGSAGENRRNKVIGELRNHAERENRRNG